MNTTQENIKTVDGARYSLDTQLGLVRREIRPGYWEIQESVPVQVLREFGLNRKTHCVFPSGAVHATWHK